ncbi:MAG: transcription termination factor Rho [Gammaproteobacteria bacterium]
MPQQQNQQHRRHQQQRRNAGNNNKKIPSEIARLEAANAEAEAAQEQEGGAPADGEVVSLDELRALHVGALVKMAAEFGVDNPARLRKQELLFAMLKARAKQGLHIHGRGTLEVMNDGYGFLRFADQSYAAGPGDIYVSPNQIRRHRLVTGDMVGGHVRTPRDNERYFALSRPESVNGVAVDEVSNTKILFENLTPLFPSEMFKLERKMRADENITGRIIDIISPIGKGQRGLLVSSPKSGKTVMLQHIAHAIEENYPEVTLFVLLIDERPEEVTEMKRSVRGEVLSSTFDEAAARHVQVAEMVIERAKRLVEMRKDVVILLDSITRLARAYNTVQPVSGRVLTGGVDAQALQRPKRFFGAARNIEEGGSLTIIATALVETGSKMDDVIYEEFKGTGNMEIHLDRRLSERRVYPAVQVGRSGTRREELLLSPEVLKNAWVLRKALAIMDDDKAAEFLIDRMRETKTNEEFFNAMKRG